MSSAATAIAPRPTTTASYIDFSFKSLESFILELPVSNDCCWCRRYGGRLHGVLRGTRLALRYAGAQPHGVPGVGGEPREDAESGLVLCLPDPVVEAAANVARLCRWQRHGYTISSWSVAW